MKVEITTAADTIVVSRPKAEGSTVAQQSTSEIAEKLSGKEFASDLTVNERMGIYIAPEAKASLTKNIGEATSAQRAQREEMLKIEQRAELSDIYQNPGKSVEKAHIQAIKSLQPLFDEFKGLDFDENQKTSELSSQEYEYVCDEDYCGEALVSFKNTATYVNPDYGKVVFEWGSNYRSKIDRVLIENGSTTIDYNKSDPNMVVSNSQGRVKIPIPKDYVDRTLQLAQKYKPDIMRDQGDE